LLVQDAQREVRTVFVGGFWGQLVSSALWLASAALGVWVSPRAAIIELVVGGCFIFPATQLLLRLTGGRTTLSRDNELWNLGWQVAFTLPLSMLLLVPVTAFRYCLVRDSGRRRCRDCASLRGIIHSRSLDYQPDLVRLCMDWARCGAG